MQKLYTAILAVIVLYVAMTATLLAFMPDTVPVHYNASGEIDRIGSKYENLIFPAITAAMGAFFLGLAKYQRKKSDGTNEKVILYTGVCVLLLFTALGCYFMLKAINYKPEEAQKSVDFTKFSSIAIGVLLIVLGNIMPKARRNTLFGLRTKWSMANDDVWRKSQRFGGIASVICGFVMIVLAIFVPGMWNVAVMAGVIAALIISCIAASYRFYGADVENKD